MTPLAESISLHSAQAKYYKYRTPYLSAMFASLAKKLQLGPTSKLLDVCCGSGEVAAGFSNYVDKIFAIDGSAEMLSHASQNNKIIYSNCDVNSEEFTAPSPVDHFVIGRAIHWIAPDRLMNLVRNNLKDGGKIVICSAEWASKDQWYPTYLSLIERYRSNTKNLKLDFTGADTLGEIGFKMTDQFTVTGKFTCTIEYLINERLSSTYGEALEKLISEIDIFKSNMVSSLSPHLKNGKLEGDISSWTIIYEKK